MKYKIIKLIFNNHVHFGERRLSDSGFTFKSDSFYSALMIEAVKLGLDKEFLDMVRSNQLLISDLFPYKHDEFFLPKPNIKLPYEQLINKKFRQLEYISAGNMPDFILHRLNIDEECEKQSFGESSLSEKVSLQSEESEPYVVGIFQFQKDAGLYLIAKVSENAESLLDSLLKCLSLTGIGGKRTAGYGKFEFRYEESRLMDSILNDMQKRKLLISTAITPNGKVPPLDNARYKLIKRSGFIDSEYYSQTPTKKTDIYAFQAGSTFPDSFDGDVFIVGNKGNHPVYKFLKPLFISFGGAM